MPRSRAGRRVMLVEDDATFREVLARELRDLGFETAAAADATAAENELAARPCDVVLLDQRLPGRLGIELLRDLRRRGNDVPVIFLTGHGDIDTAVQAVKAGAFHFLTKPCNLAELASLIDLALEPRPAVSEPVARERDRVVEETLIGSSPAMQAVRNLVRKVAPSEMPVLVTGESGTGKELVARMIHRLSQRAAGPFVAVNCASFPENLVEAEFFGSEKGAFTGADRERPGLVDAARGGTLFLDELEELSLSAQAKLLRLLEDGSFRRVGSVEERKADIRLVAATNRPLESAIAARDFRGDLYFRLSVLELSLPPLRERKGDIADLIQHFCRTRGQPCPPELKSPAMLARLGAFAWPGNVRELLNVLDRALILSEKGGIDARIVERHVGRPPPEVAGLLPDRLEDLEMMHIKNVLERCGGNKTQAARILGISVKTLYNKLKGE